jgi:hypothetical protein
MTAGPDEVRLPGPNQRIELLSPDNAPLISLTLRAAPAYSGPGTKRGLGVIFIGGTP